MKPCTATLSFRSLPVMIFTALIVLAACQAEPGPTPTETAEMATVQIQEPEPTETPEATETPDPTATSEPQPTRTSPVPTPTAPITPTPSATPIPIVEPTFYTIQAGDTLFGIADQFKVTTDALLYSNGVQAGQSFSLIAGQRLQIPLCEAHQFAAGNTLGGVAGMCSVGLDDLVTANIAILAPLGTLDAIPVGITLAIPQNPILPPDLDCSVQPEREQVIEYTPQDGEGIFCLAQKFSLSTTSIIQANVERLTEDAYGQVPLLIPPLNGAVYVVSQTDIANGVTLEDVADWYDADPEDVLDWNGNPISGALRTGQQLYIPGANLAFGPFRSAEPEPTETPEGEG
jgi:LysM repeat protein